MSVADHAGACCCAICAARGPEPEGATGARPERALGANYVWPDRPEGAGLFAGLKWAGTTLAYAFPASAGVYDADPETPGVQYGYG